MADNDRTPTSFLGCGWSFPPEFAADAGLVLMTADEEDIAGSLRILFGTIAGERFLHPRYGLDMHGLLFEPMTTTMKTYLEDLVRIAILVFEPRISLLRLEVDTSVIHEGRLAIVVDYSVRATNSRYNLVYPFYVTDSNELRDRMRSQGSA
ncbi:MAG: GPW/gp25 family protein [Thermodesulfobacteriota bacterium]